MTDEIMSAVSGEVFGVWFLIGAALVFWMQAGFAMVEAGFTRAKNTGNIIMKNLMDFCIGTVVFILIGFGLLLGEDLLGSLLLGQDIVLISHHGMGTLLDSGSDLLGKVSGVMELREAVQEFAVRGQP